MLRLQGHRCAEWRLPPSRCCVQTNAGVRLALQGRERSCRCIVAAAAAQDAAAGPVVAIPQSREEAVKAAAAAVLPHIKSLTGSKRLKKGFAAPSSGSSSTIGSSNRFSVELPLADNSPAETVKLTAELLALLPAAALNEAAVVFASEAAAAAAAGGLIRRGKVLSLTAACQGQQLAGPIVVVEPATVDVALVDQLLTEVWAGGPSWALLVNPTWQSGSVPAEYAALVGSVQAAYCFMPIATQGLMRVEGAVLRDLSSSSSSTMWRVLVKQGDQFVQVGQMKSRPSQSDLELVLLNAKAASSPLTSLVKGVKGMLDRGKKG